MNTRKLIAYSLLLSASTLLLLASCDSGTETELTAGRDMPLPEGRYPLRFTATQEGNAVQTRLTEDANDPKKTLWTAGTDKIGVSIGEDGAAGEYTVTATDGSAMTAEQEVYWQDRNAAYIHGWFPATTDALPKTADDSSIDLSDQSSGKGGYLRFDFMKAKTTQQYQYNSEEAISLPFEHQMAKMNITLTSSNDFDLNNAKVEIYGYTSCTFDKGTVTAGAEKGYITACCTDNGKHVYRAMVAPIEEGDFNNEDFIKVTLKDKAKPYYCKTGRKLEANKLYSYTVDAFGISPTDAEALRDIKGVKTIKGDGTVTNNRIFVTDDATVTLDNVNIKTTITGVDAAVIRVREGKQLTLIVKGNSNNLETEYGGGIVLEKNASIKIEGDGANSSKLVVKAGKFQIVGYRYNSIVGIGAARDATCGNIEIKNVALEVSGSEDGKCAAIGTNENSICGDITITDANVTATGGKETTAIGANKNSSCGNITINNNATVTATGGKDAAAIGTGAGTKTCGDITITNATVTATSGENAAAIGTREGTCGDITINSNATVIATGGKDAAAIGTGAGSTVCGDITITNATVTATGGENAAAIGMGFAWTEGATEKVGNITISNSTINATVTGSSNYGACIGLCYSCNAAIYNCGTITITDVDETTFLSNLKYKKVGSSDTQNFGYKIGKGYSPGGIVTFNGGTFLGTPFTDGYSSLTASDESTE